MNTREYNNKQVNYIFCGSKSCGRKQIGKGDMEDMGVLSGIDVL